LNYFWNYLKQEKKSKPIKIVFSFLNIFSRVLSRRGSFYSLIASITKTLFGLAI
jgi:hypothetical protein